MSRVGPEPCPGRPAVIVQEEASRDTPAREWAGEGVIRGEHEPGNTPVQKGGSPEVWGLPKGMEEGSGQCTAGARGRHLLMPRKMSSARRYMQRSVYMAWWLMKIAVG